MGVFLYYIPGVAIGEITRDMLLETPLAVPLRDCLESSTTFQQRLQLRAVHANGPDKGNGTIVAPVPPVQSDQPIGVYHARQTWEKRDGIWIGIDKECPPDTLSLARPKQLAGHERELGGLAWNIPIVRRIGKIPMVPQVLGPNAGGEFEMTIRPDWDAVWQQSGVIWDQMRIPGRYEFELVFSLCASMLAINYRVGPQELSILQTIDTENYVEVYEAVVDWPLIQEMQAQNDPNGQPPVPASGPGDSSSLRGSAA